MDPALLCQPHLSLITREVDRDLLQIRERISRPVMVDGRADVEEILSRLARHSHEPISRTLDLIGHSTPDHSLLVLGDWVIDGTSKKVTSFFRNLVDCEVLVRAGISSIRLLGCETGVSEVGRRTIRELAEITNIEVFGTIQMISESVYASDGFQADHLLVSSTQLRREPFLTLVKRGGAPFQRVLDIDTLPSSPLASLPSHTRKLADLVTARHVLALIRRAEGALMIGDVTPTCEIGLPSMNPGWWHRLDVLQDGDFVRCFPDGEDRPGVVFPVIDAKRLRELIATLEVG